MENKINMTEQLAPVGHNRNTLLLAWDNVKKQLDALKEEELSLRKQIGKLEFDGCVAGTNRVELGNGYKLKAVISYNYKITKNEKATPPDYSHLPAIFAKLSTATAQEIIRWKPELNESLYKKLNKEEQEICNEFLLITDGAPQMSIEEPKKK